MTEEQTGPGNDDGRTAPPTPLAEIDDAEKPPRILVDTIRPQTEAMRLARIALRDADYKYEALGVEDLRVLARRLAPEEAPETDTKPALIAALKKASIR